MRARPNLVLGVVVGVVAILVVVAAVVASTRTSLPADPTTPAGTVQLFVTAVLDGDDEAAVALLDPALGCRAPLPQRGLQDARVSFAVAGTRLFGDRAGVEVDVTQYGSGGPFDAYSHRETYELVAHGDGWLITGEPWPVYICEK